MLVIYQIKSHISALLVTMFCFYTIVSPYTYISLRKVYKIINTAAHMHICSYEGVNRWEGNGEKGQRAVQYHKR